nr:Chain B, C-terminal peptide from Immunoglobulin superfamily member 5 [Mus musculus]
YKVRNVTLV